MNTTKGDMKGRRQFEKELGWGKGVFDLHIIVHHGGTLLRVLQMASSVCHPYNPRPPAKSSSTHNGLGLHK